MRELSRKTNPRLRVIAGTQERFTGMGGRGHPKAHSLILTSQGRLGGEVYRLAAYDVYGLSHPLLQPWLCVSSHPRLFSWFISVVKTTLSESITGRWTEKWPGRRVCRRSRATQLSKSCHHHRYRMSRRSPESWSRRRQPSFHLPLKVS